MPIIDVAIGPLIQMAEAASLGMPFEVWKTRMGRHRSESTAQAFANVYKDGGARAFWRGTQAKMVESATKGAILMYAKEGINDSLLQSGVAPGIAGIAAGAGGGIAQVSVMGPCTYLVTGAVNSPGVSTVERIRETYARGGIAGFYPGGIAIAFRQATNWASRQGFTEIVRDRAKIALRGDADGKLTKWEEVGCGIVGGTLASWNHPFEVARIEAQSRGNAGLPTGNMVSVMRDIVKENGVGGLFRGIIPRIGLGIWQTLFMVTGAKMLKETLKEQGYLEGSGSSGGH
jgi:hypothetical protein|tara:strand:- start:4511 stop:5374 length:864 start_codon:yes stop_codon:yes gene_type:complete